MIDILEFIEKYKIFFGITVIIPTVVLIIFTIVSVNSLLVDHRLKTCLQNYDNKKACLNFAKGSVDRELENEMRQCRFAFSRSTEGMKDCIKRAQIKYR